ncbi:deoxyribodipyrimidine photo-lyase [Chitinivorax sp. B]|uniref:cryptochrome/photolyase family protein n=1 Tax=Chitinivorax sp. B TaxID=2502235 RepID=UPI0010F73B23|nr:deoxyribodipyrimidine photo-lyase [Chitinivorax sp. B]
MAQNTYQHVLCWFRRDLRLGDHAALYHALKYGRKVTCVFVFDRTILDALPKQDRRVEFIWHSVAELKATLQAAGGDLMVLQGDPRSVIPELAADCQAEAVYCNHDYEPDAIARDQHVAASLRHAGRQLFTFKDQVIFEKDEVLTQSSKPFTAFTPYKNAWLKKLTTFHVKPYPVEHYLSALAPGQTLMPTLADLGCEPTDLLSLRIRPGRSGAQVFVMDFLQRIDRYKDARDFPAIKGVSYLSVHLRFGTVSIRQLVRAAWHGTEPNAGPGHEAWLNELIWRDFYHQILWHHPYVVSHAFKPEYDTLPFPNDEHAFQAWCEGRTGYPIVDAAMRQLNHSGYMHNRLRMIVASFLVKDLHVDWRWGERYFAEKLIDFDLSANNGGWQWAASTGCDAQPYFRIFNPVTQSEKFDPKGAFIRRYVPELERCPDRYLHAPWMMPLEVRQAMGFVLGQTYPAPIVDHAKAREFALILFGRQ